MWSAYQCRCCGAKVSRVKERRTLDNAVNAHAAALLVRFLSQHCGKPEAEVESLLPPVDPFVRGLDHSYVCKRPCYAAFEKLISNEKKIAAVAGEAESIK